MDYSQVFSVISILNGVTFCVIMFLMGKMQISITKIELENKKGQEFKIGNLIMAFFIWQLVQLFFSGFNRDYGLLQGYLDSIVIQILGIVKICFDFIFSVFISVIFYKLAGQLFVEDSDEIILFLMIVMRFFILIFDLIGFFELFSLIFGIIYIFILAYIPLKIAIRSPEDKTLELSTSKIGMGLFVASGIPQILILLVLFFPIFINISLSYEIILLMGILGWFINILSLGSIYMGTVDYSSHFYHNLKPKNLSEEEK